MIDTVKIQLEGRHATTDANLKPTLAYMVQHADFLRETEWGVKSQQIDQRAHVDVLCRLGHHAEIDAGCRAHVERGGVMLGNMQTIKPGLVRRFHKFNPFVELLRKRPVVGAVDMIKQTKFHY